MKKLIMFLILMVITISSQAGVGYISGSNYLNSWLATGETGETIVSETAPVDIYIDTIIVTGTVDSHIVIYINGYEVRRYGFSANQTVGEVLIRPVLIPAGTNFIVIVDSGASGSYSVSVGGYLQ